MKPRSLLFISFCVTSMLAIPSAGCSFLSQAQYAKDEVVKETNRALPLVEVFQTSAEVAYEAEQRVVVMQAVQEKVSEEVAVARVKKVREKWAPLWVKFDQLRALNVQLKKVVDGPMSPADISSATGLITQFVQVQREAAELYGSLKGPRK